ncbi:hypothetical protein XELAEV_18013998mg [Xenopus laevis]|uniref:Uncharacterized protein n=1 Tax=Xenopus laevis TaxID=8355 RepID=A0A974DQW1_XENLA|nr:hypothetical protein XELAEV_18013998mg [Xenopus laevis]
MSPERLLQLSASCVRQLIAHNLPPSCLQTSSSSEQPVPSSSCLFGQWPPCEENFGPSFEMFPMIQKIPPGRTPHLLLCLCPMSRRKGLQLNRSIRRRECD